MAEVKISTKHQIVVPREVREALRLKAGDRLLLVVRGDSAILIPRPKKYSRAIIGLAKEAYPSGYLNDERNAWR
jgi:AbrB family looped-hinge helix DNA binding protein